MLYSKNGSYPLPIPFRIKLSDGRSRTDPSTFTAEEIIDAGYIQVENPPVILSNEVLLWTGTNWLVRNKTEEEILSETNAKWDEIRNVRGKLLSQLDWRFIRYQSQVRLGLTTTDSIEALDAYAQALRDITLQSDPDNIVWPTLG